MAISFQKRSAQSLAVAGMLCVPALAMAGGGAGHEEAVHHFFELLGPAVVSTIAYVFLIVKFGGPGIQSHFKARRDELTANIDEAARLAAAAEDEVNDIKAKLEGIEAEKSTLLSEQRTLGEAEAAKIVSAAKEQAAKIEADAKLVAAQERRAASADLESRMVDRAVELAEAQLVKELTAGRQTRMNDAGIAQIKNLAVSAA